MRCERCGRPVAAILIGTNGPILCDFHAWALQQEQARRDQSGGSPPPEAYRDVQLDENWWP
jgi:hypothetical protein